MNIVLLGKAVLGGRAAVHISKAEFLFKPGAPAYRRQGASRVTAPQGFTADIS